QEIGVLNQTAQTERSLNDVILAGQAIELFFHGAARAATLIADATAEFLPTDAGFSIDPTSTPRGGIRLAGALAAENLNETPEVVSLGGLAAQQAKEDARGAGNIKLRTLHRDVAVLGLVAKPQQSVGQEAVSRYDFLTLREGISQAAGTYLATLARGNSVIEN